MAWRRPFQTHETTPQTAMPMADTGQQKGPDSAQHCLHSNNASLHITKPTLQKLNQLGNAVLPHPPCLPDLLPPDYSFFKYPLAQP